MKTQLIAAKSAKQARKLAPWAAKIATAHDASDEAVASANKALDEARRAYYEAVVTARIDAVMQLDAPGVILLGREIEGLYLEGLDSPGLRAKS